MRIKPSHLGEIAWIALGQLLTLLGGVLGIKLLTTLLQPEQYGLVALTATFAAFSQQIWSGPLLAAVSRHVVPCQQSGGLPTLLTTAAVMYVSCALVQTVLMSSGILIAGRFGVELAIDQRMLLLLGALLAAIQPAFELAQAIYLQLRQRRRVAIYDGLFAFGKPIAAVLLVLFVGATATSAVVGFVVATAGLAILQISRLFSTQRQGRIQTDLATNMMNFALPYVSWGLLAWGVTAGDRWLLGMASSAAAVGLYVAAFQVSTIIPRMLSQLISSFLAPILNRMAGGGKHGSGVNSAIVMTLIAILALGIVGILGFGFLARYSAEFLSFFTGSGYESVSYTLPWLFLGSVINEMAMLSFGVGPLLYRPQVFVRPRILAYVATLVLMATLTMAFQLAGLVAAYVAGAILHFLVTSITAWRLYWRHRAGADATNDSDS
jgi:O-antigen/teichoic acid export membrane protein